MRGMLAATLLLASALVAPAAIAQQGPPPLTAEEVARKAEMQALGEQYATAWDLYSHFVEEAGGGTALTVDTMPDWSGVWTRGKGGLSFDPDIPAAGGPTTAQLTPDGAAIVEAKRVHLATTGGEYDPISDCRPPGTPRWFTEPFLKEWVVLPYQTWLMNEMVNDVRRIYTDGRPHTPPEEAYPTWNGDSIGFWDGDTLVAHTAQLMPGQYQRGVQPAYSDQVEIVERWHKVDDRNIHVDVWVYDPVHLAAPWYTRQIYTKLTDPEHSLRLRYWDCGENDNNDIIIRADGTSQFPNFDFVEDDAKVSTDPAVNAASPAPAN